MIVRCEWITPFGSLVVPEVNADQRGRVGVDRRRARRSARASSSVGERRGAGGERRRRGVADDQPARARALGEQLLVHREVVGEAEAVGGDDDRRVGGAEDVVDLLGAVEVHDRHDDGAEVGGGPEGDAGLDPVRAAGAPRRRRARRPGRRGGRRGSGRRRSTSAKVPDHGRTFECTWNSASPRAPRPSATIEPRVPSSHQPSARYRCARSSGTRPQLPTQPSAPPSRRSVARPTGVARHCQGERDYHPFGGDSGSDRAARAAPRPRLPPVRIARVVEETADAALVRARRARRPRRGLRLRGRAVLHLPGVDRRRSRTCAATRCRRRPASTPSSRSRSSACRAGSCRTGCSTTCRRRRGRRHAARPACSACTDRRPTRSWPSPAGSGITPVLSIIKAALATTERRVRLLYANRDADVDDLRAPSSTRSAADAPRPAPARAPPRRRRRLRRRRRRPPASSASRGGADVYVCGPGPFMDLVEATLLDDGVDRRPDPHRAVHPGRAVEVDGRAGRTPTRRRWSPSSSTAAPTPSSTAPAPRSCRPPARWACRRRSRARRAAAPPAWRRLLEGTVQMHVQQRAHRRRGGRGLDPHLPVACPPRRRSTSSTATRS